MATNSNYVWNKLKNGLEESKDDIISNVLQQQEANNVHSAVASATGAIDKEAGLANAIDATFNSGSGSNNSIKGAPDDLVSTANSKFSQSDSVTATDSERSGALNNLSNLASKESILSSGVIKGLEKEFKVPNEVTQADAYLTQQLEKIQSGKTSYTDQVKEMMNKIMNREDFTYDVNTDPLFQQALSSAMNSGKQAMQDTIGQASALTGGYGSTYATTAGNQAYNSYIEDAYDNLPQYYQMALDAYNAEGEEMYQQFSMLNTLDEQEYNRNITAYDATFDYRNKIYDEAYTQFRDYKSDLVSIGNLQLNEYGQRVNAASSYYNAIADYSDSLYSREYNSWLDSVNQATEMIKLYNNDYWKQTEFDESVRQYEKTYEQTDRHHSENLAFDYANLDESKRQHDENLAFDYANLDESKRQHDENLAFDYANLDESKRQHDENLEFDYANLKQTDEHHDENLAFDYANLDESKRQHDENVALDRDKLKQEDEHHDEDLAHDDKWNQKNLDFAYDELEQQAEQNQLDRDAKVSSGGSGGSADWGDGLNLSTAETEAMSEAYWAKGGGEDGVWAATLQAGMYGADITNPNVQEVIEEVVTNSKPPETSKTTSGVISGFNGKKNDNFKITYDGKSYNVENHGVVGDKSLKEKLGKLNVSNNSAFVYDGSLYVKYDNNYYVVGATNVLWSETDGYRNALSALSQ